MAPSEPELSPQQAERVRRLLAEARHDEPMPHDVAARLDRVIAGLASESDAPAPDAPDSVDPATGAPVVRLAERRRRGRRLLLAAAAVVVGGVAVGQILGGSGGEPESASSGADSTMEDRGLAAPDRDQESDAGEVGGDSGAGAIDRARRSISKLPAMRIRSARFAMDAERLRPFATGERRQGLAAAAPRPQRYDESDRATCPPGLWGGGRYVRVGFDGESAWLVYRPPAGDTQVVDLFLCDEDTPERSATLPFR